MKTRVIDLLKPRRTTLALILAVAASAAPAAGQLPIGATESPVSRSNTTERDQPILDDNPCTGETVSGLGKLHTQTTNTSTPTMTKFSFRSHQHGKANGVQTAAAYQYQHWAENEFQSSETRFSSRIVNRKHMIRTGSQAPVKDDFFMRETILLSVNGPVVTYTVEEFKPEQTCK